MKKLGVRNYQRIKQRVSHLGTYNPNEILVMFEEDLYVKDVEEIYNFLNWVDNNEKYFGSGNYEQAFKEFKKINYNKNKEK